MTAFTRHHIHFERQFQYSFPKPTKTEELRGQETKSSIQVTVEAHGGSHRNQVCSGPCYSYAY